MTQYELNSNWFVDKWYCWMIKEQADDYRITV